MRRAAKHAVVEPDSYFTLVRQFPLRPIHNGAEYDQAVQIMNRLAVRDEGTLDPGEQDYLDAVTTFVAQYDDEHFQPTTEMAPLDILRHLMESNDMTISDLGRVIGSQPAASMIVSGKRGISKTQAKRLAERFRVDAGLFL